MSQAPEASEQTSETPETNHSSESHDTASAEAEKLAEAEKKYLYLYAEFENFKKRSIKERSELMKFGWEKVARELLQVLDNLERAVEHAPAANGAKDSAALLDGLKMVLIQFKAALAKEGVQEIPAVNQPFNPELHEAMGQEPSDLPQGHIVKELTKGYTLYGRLLRPSRVTVSAGPKN